MDREKALKKTARLQRAAEVAAAKARKGARKHKSKVVECDQKSKHNAEVEVGVAVATEVVARPQPKLWPFRRVVEAAEPLHRLARVPHSVVK